MAGRAPPAPPQQLWCPRRQPATDAVCLATSTMIRKGGEMANPSPLRRFLWVAATVMGWSVTIQRRPLVRAECFEHRSTPQSMHSAPPVVEYMDAAAVGSSRADEPSPEDTSRAPVRWRGARIAWHGFPSFSPPILCGKGVLRGNDLVGTGMMPVGASFCDNLSTPRDTIVSVERKKQEEKGAFASTADAASGHYLWVTRSWWSTVHMDIHVTDLIKRWGRGRVSALKKHISSTRRRTRRTLGTMQFNRHVPAMLLEDVPWALLYTPVQPTGSRVER